MKKTLAGRSLDPLTRRLRPTLVALLALLLTVTTLTTPAGAADVLDPTFGTNGLVTTDLGATEIAEAAAVQPDGKLVVVGIAAGGVGASLVGDILVLRYKADGSLDTAFGAGGKVLLDFGDTADSPAAVLVQSDGKIVVVGGATQLADNVSGFVSYFVLARLNPDGTPDNTFGAGGKLKTKFDTPLPASAVSAAIQPDGRVVIAGLVQKSGGEQVFAAADFFAARFNPDGTPDATFGTQGHTSVDFSDYDVAIGVTLQPDGKILLAGIAGANLNNIGSTVSFALARLKSDGMPDPTFDGDGRVTTTFYGYDYANGVALQADGKIVAAGTAAAYGINFIESDFALARYEANGALDPTFGAGGRVTLDFDSGRDTALGVAAAPNGRLLVGGYTFPHDFRLGPSFGAARLNPDGSPDNTFGAGGRAATRFPGDQRADARGMTAQPDGKLILVGDVEVLSRPQDNFLDLAVARYGASAAAEPTSFARFSSQTYGASEGCVAATVTVTREGDLSAPATVEYRTHDGSARQLSDYTQTMGTLNFAAGESSKTFAVPVNDDAFDEETETINVDLVGGSANINFRVPASATLNVTDDDTGETAANPLDNSQSFVCQHYHDFLSREPDAAGLQFWTQGIERCGADARCREVKRIDVSTAFFLSIEFQQTGYFVIRAHKAAFGNDRQTPRYFDFLRDTQRVAAGVVVGTPGADARLEANRQAFAVAFVARPEFVALHREQSAGEYVDSLFRNAGVVPTQKEFLAAIAAYGAGGDAGRAAALRSVVESDAVYRGLYNVGFVLSQYFGYLRRDPDDPPDFDSSGYDFWLSKLDSFSLPGENVRDERVALERVRRAEMVKAFVTSLEYRRRFGEP